MLCHAVAEDYPQIEVEDWYVDIMAANLVDPATRSRFQVFLLPNLYGDILTDAAAQLQGGVGTAGSANIGTRYAMFDSICCSRACSVKSASNRRRRPNSAVTGWSVSIQSEPNLADGFHNKKGRSSISKLRPNISIYSIGIINKIVHEF